jgi:hypothetical protein
VQPARDAESGLIEPGHAAGGDLPAARFRNPPSCPAARAVSAATVPGDSGMPNSPASACAVRFFDKHCPACRYTMTAAIRGHPRRGHRAIPGLPVHLHQPRVGQVPALQACADQGRDHALNPVALPGVGAALTICCMCPVVMSWHVTVPMTGAANRSHSLRWVCACLRDHCPWTGRRSGDR